MNLNEIRERMDPFSLSVNKGGPLRIFVLKQNVTWLPINSFLCDFYRAQIYEGARGARQKKFDFQDISKFNEIAWKVVKG